MELNENFETNPDITTLRRDPNRGFRTWNINEIYLGDKTKKGKYVPNKGDLVFDISGGILREKEVISVDDTTYIPVLRELKREEVNDNQDNQFRGVGPGYQSETWRIFYDPNVSPATLMVDTNLHVYGRDASYMKLFLGRNTGKDGKVISQYRDPANPNSYSENVPLHVLGTRFDDSPAIKRPAVCHTTEPLHVGDEITAVVYTASGIESSSNVFLVANGACVRQLDTSMRYITGVELISPFLSASDDSLIEFPSNMPREGLFTMARVSYSDGETQDLTIDGSRVAISGLDHYISTIRGETSKLALTYFLGENESAWGANAGVNRHVTRIYRYRTLEVDGSYSVFLNVIPQWMGEVIGWELRYHLYNLDRNLSLDVTDLIEAGVNSEIFNGKKYNRFQHISVALELSKLGLGLNNFRYVQSFSIGLNGNPLNNDIPYLIHYHVGQSDPYGEYARVSMGATVTHDTFVLNLNGFSKSETVKDFLKQTYFRAKPLYNENVEAGPLTPTHFNILYKEGDPVEYPIDQFNQDIDVDMLTHGQYQEGDTIIVEWLFKRDRVTKYLNMTPFILRRKV